MRLRLPGCLMLCCFAAAPVWGQQDGLLQIDDPLHRFLTRQQVLGRLPEAILSHQPLSAYEARRHLDALDTSRLGHLDEQLYARFLGQAPGPGVATFRKVMPFAYRNGRDFLSVEHEDYAFQVNPLFYLTYGRARQTERPGGEASVAFWQNTRGVRAAGHVGRHLFFEARLEENQRRDVRPAFGLDTAPRLGRTKFNENQVYDYTVATGVVGLRTKYFEVRFGRDRNRWGLAQGSLMLSNYAPVYDQLQIRTTVWRLQYTNLFTRFTDQTPRSVSPEILPRKYGAFHRLALQLPGRVELELFETVLFASPDSLGVRDGFEWSYLNPIIFYRAVESDLVDPDLNPDNVLLGGGISWIAYPGLRLRTQLLLDELTVSQIGKGWWGNKWGWLLGFDLADFPVPNLLLQVEYARLRPYLYGHRAAFTSYTHYNDLLGHPAGPNSEDAALFLAYQPTLRWRAALTLARTRRGRDTEDAYYGADPLRSYTERVADTDVRLLQGVRQTYLLAEARAGYEFLPDVYLELALRAESVDDAETGTDRYVAPFVMLRWGLPFQSVRY